MLSTLESDRRPGLTRVITSETLLQKPDSRDLSGISSPVHIVDQLEKTTLRPLSPEDSSLLMRGPNGEELEDIGLFNGEPYPLVSFKGVKGMWQEGLRPAQDHKETKAFEIPQWAVLKTDVVKGVYAGSFPQRFRVLQEVDTSSSSGGLQTPLFGL